MRKIMQSVAVDIVCLYAGAVVWLIKSGAGSLKFDPAFFLIPVLAVGGFTRGSGIDGLLVVSLCIIIALLAAGVILKRKFGVIAAVAWPISLLIGVYIGMKLFIAHLNLGPLLRI
jgi:hypothetical protein